MWLHYPIPLMFCSFKVLPIIRFVTTFSQPTHSPDDRNGGEITHIPKLISCLLMAQLRSNRVYEMWLLLSDDKMCSISSVQFRLPFQCKYCCQNYKSHFQAIWLHSVGDILCEACMQPLMLKVLLWTPSHFQFEKSDAAK